MWARGERNTTAFVARSRAPTARTPRAHTPAARRKVRLGDAVRVRQVRPRRRRQRARLVARLLRQLLQRRRLVVAHRQPRRGDRGRVPPLLDDLPAADAAVVRRAVLGVRALDAARPVAQRPQQLGARRRRTRRGRRRRLQLQLDGKAIALKLGVHHVLHRRAGDDVPGAADGRARLQPKRLAEGGGGRHSRRRGVLIRFRGGCCWQAVGGRTFDACFRR